MHERTWTCFSLHFYLTYILQRFPTSIAYADLFLTAIAFKSRNLLCHLETLVILKVKSVTGDYKRCRRQVNQGRSDYFARIS